MVERPDGCATLAETISRCRPQMICAYPDRAHPRILDTLRAMAIDGTLAGCDVVDVESDAAAMSVAIGASGAGARTYTVTAGQGLLSMAAAVFDAAGLGLPIVRGLVQAQGGRVTLESAVNRGTSVCVFIPANRVRKPARQVA